MDAAAVGFEHFDQELDHAARGVELATLLALGIYEDTGNFLHASTTGADLQAASWLLQHGANLDIVSQFISQDLSARQIGLLNNLLKNATTYTIQSIEIVVTKLTLQEYEDSFAV
ncbi:MAG: hypothetical protein RDV41_14945, partial [Planctomycetota bacterium]|nr:hypothetical protein [Planctomycetota bacterium]